jgi:hypothetical protein
MPSRSFLEDHKEGFSLSKIKDHKNLIAWVVIGVIAAIFGLKLASGLAKNNNSGYFMVRQAFITGNMSARMSPGWFLNWMGKTSQYQFSDIIYFSKHEAEGSEADESISVRFNDGGTANVTGNVRYILSTSEADAIKVQRHFRSHANLLSTCLTPLVHEAVILTAAMMSSEESYTTKRALFSEMARDQVLNGIYLTEQEDIRTKDIKTGEETIHLSVMVKRDANGNPLRKDNPLHEYSIKMDQFVIKEIDYEPDVLKQIQTKRDNTMKTVSAKAVGEQAVQERLTAEEEGKKNVSISKYQAEVDKKTAVVAAEQGYSVALTQANQQLAVSKFDAQAAESELTKAILKAEADYQVARKRLTSNGAIELRANAYKEIVEAWTTAFAGVKEPLVPEISSEAGMNGVSIAFAIMQNIIDKLSKEFQVSLSPNLPTNIKDDNASAPAKTNETIKKDNR